jgi:hypothetical protein
MPLQKRFAAINAIRGILREPLVYFLAIGVALFVLFAVFGGDDGVARDDVIRVSADDVDRLRSLWGMQYKRPPTETELQGVIDTRIREEVLNREAKLLGLDRDDVIIRRRLAQKMEFLSEDFATAVPPTEEEIVAYYADHSENYRIPEGASFSHVFFNADKRGETAARQDAGQLQRRLNGTANGGKPEGGDPFVLPMDYDSSSLPEVEELFGKTEFTDAVFSAELNVWTEPARSAYGFHIIYVRSRTASRLPALDEVRAPVRRDLVSQRRRDANDAFDGALLENYTVVVETDADG